MASSDARPVPQKGVAYRVTFPILDADGDLVGEATGLDSIISLDGASFDSCTNEATEIGTTGVYYLDLTSGEMDADTVVVLVQTSTEGAKTTTIVLYPEEVGDVRCDVTAINGDDTVPGTLADALDGTALLPVNVAEIDADSAAAENLAAIQAGTVLWGVVAGIPAADSFSVTAADLAAEDHYYIGSVLVFTSGALRGIARRISSYNSSKVLGFEPPFPDTPAEGDEFLVLGRIN
jgi:hypothetical protein